MIGIVTQFSMAGVLFSLCVHAAFSSDSNALDYQCLRARAACQAATTDCAQAAIEFDQKHVYCEGVNAKSGSGQKVIGDVDASSFPAFSSESHLFKEPAKKDGSPDPLTPSPPTKVDEESYQKWAGSVGANQAVTAPVAPGPPSKILTGTKRDSELTITSRTDQLVIYGLIINRGNCPLDLAVLITAWGAQTQFPMTLRFGDKLTVDVECDPIEIIASTDKGNQTLYWR